MLGHVTSNLRMFSVEEDGKTIKTLAVFAAPPSAHEIELTQFAGTGIIANYVDAMIDEQWEVSTDRSPRGLTHVVYLRYEPGDDI